MKSLTYRSHSFNITKPDAIKQGVAFTATTAARIAYTAHGRSVCRSAVPVTYRQRRAVALPA